MSFVVTLVFLLALAIVAGWFLIRKITRANTSQSAFGRSSLLLDGRLQPAFLLVFGTSFLVCVIISTIHYAPLFLPYPKATPQTEVVGLFNATTIVTGIAFFITQSLLFYFSWRFRKAEKRTASFITGSNKLELLWTVLPAVAFIFLFVWGHILWTKIIAASPTNALEIEVMAEQFNWKVRYAGRDQKLGRTSFRFINDINEMGIDTSDPDSKDDFVPVQMHIPKGRPIRLTLRSKDVIHSFYIPFFRTKMDAVPGMRTSLNFTATETTSEMRAQRKDSEFEYEIACAELCGRMHFAMKLILVVDDEKAFDAWYNNQPTWISEHKETKLLTR